MQYCGMQTVKSNLRFADTAVINYTDGTKTYTEQQVNEIKTNYEQQANEIKANYERQINKLKNNAIESENKYLEIKEKYELLIYKRFGRSAEQLPVDQSRPLLFTPEAEPVEIPDAEEKPEKTEVKSYSRNKPGRKPIDPNIPRVEKVIDIPEEEKKCACGADLNRIGE